MSTDWSRPTRYIAGVCLVLLGIFALYLSRSVIPLLIIAALIAVMVSPLIRWLHQRVRLPRGLAVLLVYLLVVILVPLALLLAIPALVDAVQYVLNLDYQGIIQRFTEWLRSTLIAIKTVSIPVVEVDATIDQAVDVILAELSSRAVVETAAPPSVEEILGSLGTALTATFRTVAGVAGSVFSRIALVLFIFLISIHISLTAHTFQDTLLHAVPERFQPEISVLMARIVQVWSSFFRGQITLMIVIGVISWLGLTILGVPGALYLGIIAGLLELIPNLGPILATIPAVIVALLQGSTYLPVTPPVLALIVIVFYVLVQQLENNLIVPRVLGEAVDLPALVVMAGVFVGAETAGLLGALLATPVIASAREIIRYVSRKILGEPPFPPVEETPAPAVHGPGPLRVWLEKLARFWPPFRARPPQQPLPEPSSPPAGSLDQDQPST